jgi:RNA polymerase sigma-70 factor (ECF subfamily)
VALTAADRSLLQRCLNQEAGAWREFVDRYLGLIYHVIQTTTHLRSQPLGAEDTEDLAAEVLQQILARDFAVLREFKGDCSLAAYLTVLARRTCAHELAQRTSAREAPKAAPVRANDEDTEPARDELHLENEEEVERLLGKLPPRERQVVRMFYIEGRTYDEISKELDIPRNTIGPILSRARNVLRQDSASS